MAMDLKSHIGVKVKAARQRKGFTQEELAEKIGKAVETVSNIERGFALTGLETLSDIAGVVGVPMTYFFEGLSGPKRATRDQQELEEKLRNTIGALRSDDLQLALRLVDALRQHRKP